MERGERERERDRRGRWRRRPEAAWLRCWISTSSAPPWLSRRGGFWWRSGAGRRRRREKRRGMRRSGRSSPACSGCGKATSSNASTTEGSPSKPHGATPFHSSSLLYSCFRPFPQISVKSSIRGNWLLIVLLDDDKFEFGGSLKLRLIWRWKWSFIYMIEIDSTLVLQFSFLLFSTASFAPFPKFQWIHWFVGTVYWFIFSMMKNSSLGEFEIEIDNRFDGESGVLSIWWNRFNSCFAVARAIDLGRTWEGQAWDLVFFRWVLKTIPALLQYALVAWMKIYEQNNSAIVIKGSYFSLFYLTEVSYSWNTSEPPSCVLKYKFSIRSHK